jgi:CBS domain-containing protein
MQLKDFINYRIETVSPDDTLQRAAEKMRELDVGSMPVVSAGQLVGVVTDRDITVRATARGDDPMVTKVSDVMTTDVVSCREDDTIEEVARLMQEHQIRRLFVLNENDELVGVTSLGELATATGNQQLAGQIVERVSHPGESGGSVEQAGHHTDDAAESIDTDEEPLGFAAEVRVSGLFDNAEQAKEAVEELKDAGFADDRIAIAMHDMDAQDIFISDTGVHSAPAEEIPSLPELDERQVLVMVEASERATLALEIINRNHGVTGGVRLPT